MTAVSGAAKVSGHAIGDASKAAATAVGDAARATKEYLTQPMEIRVKPPQKRSPGSKRPARRKAH